MGWGNISEAKRVTPALVCVTAGEHRQVLGKWKVVWG